VCKHHSRGKVFIASIITTLVLCLLPNNLPFSTDSRAVSAADSVFYDFVAQASSASWSSGAGSLPFPGSDSDSRGFVLYRDSWQLEDDSTRIRALETHPQWVSNGWMMGVYPQVTVPSNAELIVTVGFFKGATGSDGVTFEVKFEEFLGLQVAPQIHSILSHKATYDGKLDSIVEELSYIEGRTGNFVLYANAGQSSGQDWAAWAEARIEIATAPTLPDLTVESIEIGEDNKLSVTIKNIGQGPLPAGWTALGQIWINSQDKGTFSLQNPTSNINGGIAVSGGSATYLLPWDILKTTLVVCDVDITNDIGEANEQNNYKEEEVAPTVVELPDLVVMGIEYDQQASSVSCTIKNAGEEDTPPSFVVRLSLNDPFVYEESEVEATLKGGETYTFDFESLVQPVGQTITVQVCADTLNQVTESNEQNNCLEKIFAAEVPAPPLGITSGPSVSDITAGSAAITWTTNLESDSCVSYDTYAGKFGTSQADAQFSLEHQITLEGLTPATAYQFIAESTDETSNTAQSRPLTFMTLPAEDKEKPSLSMTLPSKLSGKREVIEIAAQDNSAVARVSFYVDGRLVFTDYSFPFRWECDTTLFGAGMHSFGAMAYDAVGNAAEIARDGEIQNLFPASDSPVKVDIVNPTSGSDVYGMVEIRATVTQDKDGWITHTEVEIDGSVVHEVNYTPVELPPVRSSRIKESKYSLVVSYLWDTSGLAPGQQHVIEVSARDEFGNAGHQGIRVTRIDGPSISIPFSITRTVMANGNCFRVELTVSNLGTGSEQRGTDVIIRDISRGFQATAFERTPAYDWLRSEVAVEKLVADFPAGGTITFAYDIVPVLFDPMLDDYTVGTRTIIEYNDTSGHRITHEYNSPYIPGDYVSYPYPLLPEEIGNAFNTVDYLIITDPERLFRYSDAEEVNALLSTMAELALQKNGVLGYRRPGTDWVTPASLKDNFTPDGIWGSRLSPESALNGYVLLVGETEIIPAWRLPCPGFFEDYTGGYIDISDYPYADVVGDERPELKVGRIIGENAQELTEPIRASLAVHLGRAAYDGSDVLFITGPEDTWESHVKNAELGRVTVAGKGVTVPVPVVHAEYWTTQHNMLAEALRIKGPDNGGAAFEPDPPMNTFDVKQLAVWLLDSEEVYWARWAIEYEQFTDSEGGQHKWAPAYIGDEEIQDALRIAERIQADREGRGGDYGWTYTYYESGVGSNIPETVKAQIPNKDIIVYFGHGHAVAWGTGVLHDQEHSAAYIEPIDFGRSRPVVIAFSCLTGNYEEAPGSSIARAFLRNGAAVYIGSTEVSSSGAAEEATREIFWRSWTRSSRIGDAFFDLRDTKMREGGGWRYFVYEYNLYGDPKFGGES
jgi:hypothetical protein